MTIWKFSLKPTSSAVLMPRGAQLLSVMVQRGEPCLWALVDALEGKVKRRIGVYGTGWDLPKSPGTFVGSFQLEGGALVFHVFDGGEDDNNEEGARL